MTTEVYITIGFSFVMSVVFYAYGVRVGRRERHKLAVSMGEDGSVAVYDGERWIRVAEPAAKRREYAELHVSGAAKLN